jgi:hypothetical protein
VAQLENINIGVVGTSYIQSIHTKKSITKKKKQQNEVEQKVSHLYLLKLEKDWTEFSNIVFFS